MNLRLAVAQIALFLALSGARLFGQPIITDFTPQVGTAGDTVHITGSGFTLSGVKVYFYNGKLAVTSITSGSQMTGRVKIHSGHPDNIVVKISVEIEVGVKDSNLGEKARPSSDESCAR